jgi:lysophospholipase L1-like esterase
MSGSSSKRHGPHPVPRGKRLLQNLGLSVATFLVCLGVAEGVLRLAGYGRLILYEPDPRLYWRPKPNQQCFTKIGRHPVRVNRHGTRGADFAVPKPAGVVRLLSLGDSRTFGWGLAEDETYSARLQALLQDYFGSRRRVEVINAGVNAWSYQQMQLFFRHVALGFQPDVVILAEANLWTQFSEHSSPEFVRRFLWRVRVKNFLRRFALYHFVVEVQLRKFYETYRTRFIPINPQQDTLFQDQQQADPEGAFRQAIGGLCALARSNHVAPVLLFLPALDTPASTNRVNILAVKQEISRSQGVPLVDVTAELAAGGKALYLDDDPVHLNARGNAIVAEQLFAALTNILSR